MSCGPIHPCSPSSFAHPGTTSMKKWFEQHPCYPVRHHHGSNYNCPFYAIWSSSRHTIGTAPNLFYRACGQGLGQLQRHRLGWAVGESTVVHPLSGVSTRRLSLFGVVLHATPHKREPVGCWTSLRIAEAEIRPARRNGRDSLVKGGARRHGFWKKTETGRGWCETRTRARWWPMQDGICAHQYGTVYKLKRLPCSQSLSAHIAGRTALRGQKGSAFLERFSCDATSDGSCKSSLISEEIRVHVD